MKPLPCPFCGGEATVHPTEHETRPHPFVSCDSATCAVAPTTDADGLTVEQAIEAWNRRVVPAEGVPSGK